MASIRPIAAHEPNLISGLSRLLRATVDGGASVGFLAPLSEVEAAEYWRETFADLGDTRLLWVAEVDGVVVGTVQLCPSPKANGRHRAEIQKLLVHPDYRGRGIAALLMAEAESTARSLGRWLLVLDTESGSVAEIVYKKLGWMPCGGVPGFALSTTGVPRDNVYYYEILAPLRGALATSTPDRGSSLRCDPRLLSGNPSGCSICSAVALVCSYRCSSALICVHLWKMG